jgi:hypothetical protein
LFLWLDSTIQSYFSSPNFSLTLPPTSEMCSISLHCVLTLVSSVLFFFSVPLLGAFPAVCFPQEAAKLFVPTSLSRATEVNGQFSVLYRVLSTTTEFKTIISEDKKDLVNVSVMRISCLFPSYIILRLLTVPMTCFPVRDL